jgi:hypothetical protein
VSTAGWGRQQVAAFARCVAQWQAGGELPVKATYRLRSAALHAVPGMAGRWMVSHLRNLSDDDMFSESPQVTRRAR